MEDSATLKTLKDPLPPLDVAVRARAGDRPAERPRVCIVGGGGTGAALAYDLALRGCQVVLVERGELTSGTTGRHHGQLHCGARYAWADRAIARECYAESVILSRIAPDCIEYNGGLFVATDETEAAREREFLDALAESGIPARAVSGDQARAMEPAIGSHIVRAVEVPDGGFDAFRLPMMFFAGARALGARILPWHEAIGAGVRGGRLRSLRVIDRSGPDPREFDIEADFFLNAGGAWAGKIGALAGADIPVSPAPGSMLAFRGRIVRRVLSRLRPPGDGDILVPQRGLSIIGSTQRPSDDGEIFLPLPEEIEFLKAEACRMVPGIAKLPVHAAWAAARPLAGASSSEAEGRSLSRDFTVIDHAASDGVAGFASIVGGKATVLRAMAEKAADAACAALGLAAPCRTAEYRLPSWRDFHRGYGS